MDKRRFFDNTKVSGYKNCRRYFYLRHYLGWTSDGVTPAPLVFGTSWHAAMDAIWLSYHKAGNDSERVDLGMAGFLQAWEEEGYTTALSLDRLKELEPRTPGNAESMLFAYLETRRPILENARVLSAERPFAVPLKPGDEASWYAGKLDKAVELDGAVSVFEHKTTTAYKKDGGFKYDFLDMFDVNAQVDGYLYAGHLLFDKLKYVYVDAALVHKTERHFKLLPSSRHFNDLDSWLWEVRTYVSEIEWRINALDEPDDRGKLEQLFPRNTEQCVGKYSTCMFKDVCSVKTRFSQLNPETPPPHGFKVEFWEPFDELGLSAIFNETETDPNSTNAKE